jgi:AsmA-like C-terminal region
MRAAWDWLETTEVRSAGDGRHRRAWLLVGVGVGIVIVGAVVYLERAWPFTRANVIKQLEQATSSVVHIGTFRHTFFPRPGCVAEVVSFERGTDPQNQTVLTVERLTVEGNLTGLFTNHVALIRAEGAHAVFPPLGTGLGWKPAESDIVVDELSANGALLDFTHHNPERSRMTFVVHEFVAHHLAAHDPTNFDLRFRNPTPPGEVSASGTFGPWKMDRVSATPAAGSYSFRKADLGVFGGIRGILSSDGHFRGTLESLEVEGATTTPDFAVRGSHNKIGLQSEFHAKVDSTNGDVTLNEVSAQLMRTTVVSHGSVAGRENQNGKTAALDLVVRSGRIQDLLLMFVSDKQAPLKGVVSLKAKTVVPQGKKPFLQKLEMTGDFGIESALFTKEKTQESLNKLSVAARGEGDQADDPENALSDLQGHVAVRDGVATFSELSFRVPGALARLHGTFNLTTEKVDLRGMLFMDAKLPQATSGMKSFLLKAIDPFLKKNKRGGAKIPVSITGT